MRTPTKAAHNRPAHPNRVAFLRQLITQRDVYPGVPDEQALALLDARVADGSLTAAAIAPIIERALTCPKKAATVPAEEPKAGMYRDGDIIYRVYLGQQSGRMLLKRIVTTDRHCAGHYDNLDGSYFECGLSFPTTEQAKDLSTSDEADWPVRDVGCVRTTWDYEYVGAAARCLPATAVPMSLEEAKAWGRMTGTCMVCARRLDVPESVDAGIGPKCARSFR